MDSEVINIWNKYNNIKEVNPLIHCITNNVTINDCANILNAVGASPVMTRHIKEVEEVVKSSNGFVCNMGAVEDFESMKVAADAAFKLGIPIIIDPVGVGGITFRRERFWELVENIKPACVRGNASEIKALVENRNTTKGVDVEKKDDILMTEKNVVDLSKKLGCLVVASGEIDIISDGERVCKIESGNQIMSKISGTGCMLSAVIGAFLACENHLESVRAACYIFGKSGELAAKMIRKEKKGIMTFKTNFIDYISDLKFKHF